MSDDYPKIRDLEAFPYSEGGKPVIMLRDPSRMAEGILVVAPEVYSILPLLNGKNSVLDIQVELTRRQGGLVFREQIEELLNQLGKAHFLDNESFRQHAKAVADQYHLRKVRPAFHADVSYPSDRNELIDQINGMYLGENGAGLPGSKRDEEVEALVAPHIDLRMGGQAYTHAYRALAESKIPDVFVIIGTCHFPLPQLFSLSSKDFETPLGISKLDRALYSQLKAELGPNRFEEDLAHRCEHTIEFQLLFLQHLYRNTDVRIVPILVSFQYRDLQRREDQRLFQDFVGTLDRVVQDSGKRACYIASADLAHMGPRYGDSFHPSQAFIEETSRKDREMLALVTSMDPQAFFDYVRAEEDRRRICGFPPIYTLLHLTKESRGRVLCHSHCKMDDSGSFVTYASMAFSKNE